MPGSLNKWSNHKRALFLEILKTTGNVSAATRAVGMRRTSLYALRRQDEDFRKEWDSALEESLDDLKGELRRRAIEGTEKPVYYGGKECGALRSYNDNLGVFLLKGRRKKVYGKDQPARGKDGRFVAQTKSPREKLLAKLENITGKPKP